MNHLFQHKNSFYDAEKVSWDSLLFDGRALRRLLVPLMLEQLLNSFMGMMDTMMVSRVGSAAISAVSLVDSINVLFIQIFAALATGGTILCSQYLGSGDRKRCSRAAEQVALSTAVISIGIMAVCLVTRGPLLRLVFGSVEPAVMQNSETYFWVTALSYPFIALFQVGSAFYRAGGNSRFPMAVSVISNIMNIVGNAIFIFGFQWGVFGAALSTTLSRIFCMAVIFLCLRRPFFPGTHEPQPIILKNYGKVRPDFEMIVRILAVGVPSGIENGMFQFGKLAIQSSVSTLGTTAIAAQAMTVIFENLNGVGGIGIGIGLMTIVGQCIGAGRVEEAKYYIVRLSLDCYGVILASCLAAYAICGPVTRLAGMDPEAAAMCVFMLGWITVVKPLIWTPAFCGPYGLRAAGDVKYSMIMSSLCMWTLRVVLTTVLIRVFHFGPIAVWIGMFSDWLVRGILYFARFRSGKWLNHHLIEETEANRTETA